MTIGVDMAGLPFAELAGLWVELSVDVSLPVEPFRCCILLFLLDNRLEIEFRKMSSYCWQNMITVGALIENYF